MKKLLFAAIVAISTIFSGTAQVPVKYQGEVDLGYSVGIGTFSAGRLNLHTVQGVKISDYFSTGLGVGLDYYHESSNLLVPIFLNMKGYYPVNEKFSPFVSLDLGYGIGVTSDVSGLGGFLWAPAVGVRYSRFKFQVGYTSQRISESGLGYNMNAIQFKLGVVF